MPARFATASMLVAPKPSLRNSAVATSRMRSESCADSSRDGRPPWPRACPLVSGSDCSDIVPEINRHPRKRKAGCRASRISDDTACGWQNRLDASKIGPGSSGGEGVATMNIDLTGKRAVICGGSRGIGRAIALACAEAGAAVSICARGAEALDKTRRDIAAHGPHAASCDLANKDQIARYIAGAAEALG